MWNMPKDAKDAACGRRFDSVALWSQSEVQQTQIKELVEENRLLRERTRVLTGTITDLYKVIEQLQNELHQKNPC